MTPFQDYPRMMFHRSGLTTVVLSRDEEDGLGADWRRTQWPAEPIHPPIMTSWPPALNESAFTPEPPAAAVPEPEEDPWDAPHPSWAPDESSAFEPAPKPKRMKKK